MGDPDYIMPSRLCTSGYSLPFSEDHGGRLWHYRHLQLVCKLCHEQGARRKHWTVDKSYTNEIWYSVPDEPPQLMGILSGAKFKALRMAIEEHNLEYSWSTSIRSQRSQGENFVHLSGTLRGINLKDWSLGEYLIGNTDQGEICQCII